MNKLKVDKVLAYVVRDGYLLVFKHKDYSREEVGVQVPAGTTNQGESAEEAVMRELKEETGFSSFKIVSKLGINEYDITPYRNEIQSRHFFLIESTEDLPERWDGRESNIVFEFFWIPLKNAHVLQSGQGSMINKIEI